MAFKDWSTIAADNASAGAINWAEGMNPNAVNDSARQMMADLRAWAEDGWLQYDHTASYASSASFTVATDVTGIYQVNRRIRAVGSATGTIHGVITASAYSAPNTTVTVQWPTGFGLANEAITVSLGPPALGWPSAMVGHPSAVKAYVRFNPSTATVIGAFNVTGVSSAATGLWTITFERPMGNTNYLMIGSGGNFPHGNNAHWDVSLMQGSSINTGSITISVASVNAGGWALNSSGSYAAVMILGDF